MKGALTGEEQEQDPASHPARGGRLTGWPEACSGTPRAARRPRWKALSATVTHSRTMQRRTSGTMAQMRLFLVASAVELELTRQWSRFVSNLARTGVTK
ncbi:hypothetical protein MRX96_050570 [Rhipicephalus microplus]